MQLYKVKSNKFSRFSFPIILVLTGLLFVGVGIYFYFIQTIGKTLIDATVVNVSTHWSGDDKFTDVYVNFIYNSITYENIRLSSFSEPIYVGQAIKIYIDPNDITYAIMEPSILMSIILFAAGGGTFIGGIISFIKTISSVKKGNELKQAYHKDFEYREINDPVKLYFGLDKKTHVKFHFFIEDESRNSLFDARMSKLTFFRPYEYTFSNHVTLKEEIHKIGHTVTSSVSHGITSSTSVGVNISSTFSYDDYDIWDYLTYNGITFKINFLSIRKGLEIEIFHNGNLIAKANSCSSLLHEEDETHYQGKIKPFPTGYHYRIEGQEDYLDVIFLVLFAIAFTD